MVTILSALVTLMQTIGWQLSMKYHTSVHGSALLQKIGVLDTWQLVLAGVLEFWFLTMLFYGLFTRLEKNHGFRAKSGHAGKDWLLWAGVGLLLYGVYLVFLYGCYPGFYNYDVGNQIPQVLYEEVPFSAHHPVLHTLLEGGIIALGYRIHGADLTLGVFLYCAFQMAVCTVFFTYSVYFLWKHTGRKWVAAGSLVFYALCPPVVMFAMSTTKDVICYAVLLGAVLKLFDIYQDLGKRQVGLWRWIQTGVLLVISCLFRKNIVYVVVLFGILAVILVRAGRRQQILAYTATVLGAVLLNRGLIYMTGAVEGSPMEALSIPVQQLTRLYWEEGEEAFEEEERELLYSFVQKEMMASYDPFISDGMKYAFWLHYDTISERMGDFFLLWAKKGLQYPGAYVASFLDNTYQAWYPGTVLKDTRGYRYFDITGWQEEFGNPKLLWLYHYYKGIDDELTFQKYPVVRLLFSIGFMFWTVLAAWFYGLWKKDRGILAALGLVLCVCVTNLAGPVSDVRYYLLAFYAFPLCVGIFAGTRAEKA